MADQKNDQNGWRFDNKPLPPYKWEAKKPTEDTEAAVKQVLADESRGRQ